MTNRFIGVGPLALVASGLPERARVGLALLAADFALDHLKACHNVSFGCAGFELARRWYDGDAIDPDRMEGALHSEDDEGIDVCALEAESEHERAAWQALGSALAYVAFHAYKAIDKLPGPLTSEVEEYELDFLNEQLDALSTTVTGRLVDAAEPLRRNPSMPFDQLRSMISLTSPG